MGKSLKYKRILLKLSGEVLEGNKGSGIDFGVLKNLCEEIAAVKKLGVEIVIVIGGGNIWRYRDFKDSGLDRAKSDYMGMMATVMNAMAMEDQFKKIKVEAIVFSALNMSNVLPDYALFRASYSLDKGLIVICGGGTGNPYFTTDSAAALRALELKCDVVLKATKVDFVYDKDPLKFKDAKKIEQISYNEVLKRELQFMDLTAISLCASKELPIIVFNLNKKGNIARAVKGEKVGTLIS